MVKDRFKELIDFAQTKSPYQNANKGWINDDIYLQWGNESNDKNPEKEHILDINLYIEPLQKLILIIFITIAISFLFIFMSISFKENNFDQKLFSFDIISQINKNPDIIMEDIENFDQDSLSQDQNQRYQLEEELIESEPVQGSEQELLSADDWIDTKSPIINSGNMLAPKLRGS